MTTTDPGTVMAESTPRSITIIALLHYLGAAVTAVDGVILLLTGGPGSILVGVVALVIAVAMVVLADKLRAGVRWARTTAMVLQSLVFISSVIALINGRIDLNLLIAPAIVLTLAYDRQARAHFGLDRGGRELAYGPRDP